jgi:hypothetical protein
MSIKLFSEPGSSVSIVSGHGLDDRAIEVLGERIFPLGRWEDGIRMDLREIGLGGCVDWIRLAQDRDRWRAVVSAVMNLRVLTPRSWLVS